MLAVPQSANLRGALWMLVSVLGATGMTVFVRLLSPDLHTAMIAFLRSVLGLALLAPLFVGRTPPPLSRLNRPGLHLIRGALIALALNLGFFAVWRLPVATATILFFLAPVFSTMLAPFLIGEKVGPRRWAAVAAGFAGALIVLRPGALEIGVGAAAAVASSACFAVALLLGKTASRADGPDAVFASSAILAALFTLPLALPHWRLPGDPALWALLIALTLASSLRGYADIRAMNAGEASFIAPVSYLRLPTVAAAGWWLFDEAVDGWTWLGGAVIAGAALFIALRERAVRPSGPPAALG
jgi:drug/metabolite transporter (DMT)-like permease